MTWDEVCQVFEDAYLSWDPATFKHTLSFHGYVVDLACLAPINSPLSIRSLWNQRTLQAKPAQACFSSPRHSRAIVIILRFTQVYISICDFVYLQTTLRRAHGRA